MASPTVEVDNSRTIKTAGRSLHAGGVEEEDIGRGSALQDPALLIG